MGDVPGEIIGCRGGRRFRLMTGVKMRIVADSHMRLGKWVIKKAGGEREPILVFVPCSPDHGQLVLEQAATLDGIRELQLLVNYPVVLRDFTIAAPEWNAEGVFYDQPPSLTPVTAETNTEIIRQVLDDLVIDFLFKDEPSRQNFFGLLLTPLLRHALDANAPMHLVMAPLERTGKTKLIEQVLGGILLGRKRPALQMSGTEEERDKRILSILLRGDTITHIDNIRDELNSAVLASLLTATIYSSRLLGASKMVDVPNNLTVVGSGNNITATGEIAKRAIPIRLQPRDDQPEERHDFHHPDVPSYISSVRDQVLSVLLGMITIWNTNGRPQGHITLGGFERWSQAVGGILKLCGYTEWMRNYGTWVKSADTVSADLRAFVAAWANDNDKPKQASALMDLANNLALFPQCFVSSSIRGQQTSFAMRVLTPNVDRPVGTWVIKRSGSGNSALYYLAVNKQVPQ
jgi:hypothetical protein